MIGVAPTPAPKRQSWHSKHVPLTRMKARCLNLWVLRRRARVNGLSLQPAIASNLLTQLELDERRADRIGDIGNPEVLVQLTAQPSVWQSCAATAAAWSATIMGTIHEREAVRTLEHPCNAARITNDKQERDNRWLHGYRVNALQRGHDSYNSNKTADEPSIPRCCVSSCNSAPHQTPDLPIRSAHADNIIGGSERAPERVMSGPMRSLGRDEAISGRGPSVFRGVHHVLELLRRPMRLAGRIAADATRAEASNLVPQPAAIGSMRNLVEPAPRRWPRRWVEPSDPDITPEASWLNLVHNRAEHQLGWAAHWEWAPPVKRTVNWCRRVQINEGSAPQCGGDHLPTYQSPDP